MPALLVRRLAALIPMLLGVTAILFVLTHLLPADPVHIALGPDASKEQIAAYRREFKLDEPLWRQYLCPGRIAHPPRFSCPPGQHVPGWATDERIVQDKPALLVRMHLSASTASGPRDAWPRPGI